MGEIRVAIVGIGNCCSSLIQGIHHYRKIELRLSVEDSPNSAGIVIDAIRCCKLALDRGERGVLYGPAAYFMKHPPRQYTDEVAYQMTEEFILRPPQSDLRGKVEKKSKLKYIDAQIHSLARENPPVR